LEEKEFWESVISLAWRGDVKDGGGVNPDSWRAYWARLREGSYRYVRQRPTKLRRLLHLTVKSFRALSERDDDKYLKWMRSPVRRYLWTRIEEEGTHGGTAVFHDSRVAPVTAGTVVGLRAYEANRLLWVPGVGW